ncbi:MAG TPA: hypothetical protein VGK73_39340, partial [Polyangiaceae bacterium]
MSLPSSSPEPPPPAPRKPLRPDRFELLLTGAGLALFVALAAFVGVFASEELAASISKHGASPDALAARGRVLAATVGGAALAGLAWLVVLRFFVTP